MRARRRLKAACFLGLIGAMLLVSPSVAAAQVVEVTPEFSITPTTETTPWVMMFAFGAAALGVLVLLGVGAGYMRFAPKFFGRQEAATERPGMRPPQLVREAAAVRWTPQAQTPGPAQAQVVEEKATEEVTAPPAAEPAAQADAGGQAEAAAPEAEAKPAPEAEAKPAPEPAQEVSTESPAQPTQAPAAATPAAQPASTASAALDQETFDRVLNEQLEKGVDRRVAEGRARAAAVVAARKKAQG